MHFCKWKVSAIQSKVSVETQIRNMRNYNPFFRWRSADGNDYLCGHCQSQNKVAQTHSKPSSPGKFGPRGFGKPDEPEARLKSSEGMGSGGGNWESSNAANF